MSSEDVGFSQFRYNKTVIVKDKDSIANATKNEAIGEAAEKQMAFLLNREFGESKDVFVFNDLRIERSGEVAQIDHLIVYRFGFVIIESKSIGNSVIINQHKEFEIRSKGIKSPIAQANLQGKLLKSFLRDSEGELLTKMLKMQTTFAKCPLDVFVAVAEKTKIKRLGNVEVPELKKADQVISSILNLMKRHKKASGLLAKPDGQFGMYKFKDEELHKIVDHLKASHVPSARAASPKKSESKVTKKMPTYMCTHCHETNLTIEYGRSYYFKCHSCDGNTPIKNRCDTCKTVTRTRKSKKEFASVCKKCDTEELFFVNP